MCSSDLSTPWTVTVDSTPPVISLTTPATDSWQASSDVTFTYAGSDTNLQSCTVFGDFTGSYAANETNNTPSGGAIAGWHSIGMANGNNSYTWNVECTDFAGNVQSNETNSTFIVDSIIPSITLVSPANGSSPTGTTINLTWNTVDLSPNSSCNTTLDDVINVTNTTA